MKRQHIIAQQLVFGLEGTWPSQDFQRLISTCSPGGVILFSRNVESPRQVAELNKELQALAPTPLWIMIDQEGGEKNRITKGIPTFPSNRYYGRLRDREGVIDAYDATARALRNLGINLNLAPVVDVETNPSNPVVGNRSFGDDPALVSELGTAAVEAIQGAGLVACAKHFPGIGDIATDPHLSLPANRNARGRFEEVDFVPFRAAIGAGVGAVMTTHVVCPDLDPSLLPASLSPKIVAILREYLRFEGMIIADDVGMKAIAETHTLSEAAQKALYAGNDLVLICNPRGRQEEILAEVVDGLERADEGQLAKSWERILTLKERFAIGEKPQ